MSIYIRPQANEGFSDHSLGKCRTTTGRVSAAIQRALLLLLTAHEYACDVKHPKWDFAIEVRRLRDTGLNECELRWLVCKGYVEHAREITSPAQDGRSFCSVASLKFLDDSCFVLTDDGVSFTEDVDRLPRQRSSLDRNGNGLLTTSNQLTPIVIPYWDVVRLELRIGNNVVKRYRVPAPNQEVVLAAFQEEEWPHRIDNPLVPAAEIDPKRRLHSTIQCLNRNQQRRLIHFRGDGHGVGICWELVG